MKLTQGVTVSHCYLDSLKKKTKKPTVFALGTMKKQETLSNRDVERQVEDRPLKTVKIIQMQTAEVKIRQFIVNRITLALHHLLTVSHALSSTSTREKDFLKSHG